MQFAYAITTVEADDEPKAAILAWLDLVGKNQAKKLRQMGADSKIQSLVHGPEAIAECFRESSLPLPGIAFIYDNQVETWLISVEEKP